MMVKIFDLEREYRENREALLTIIDKVCLGGEFVMGKEVKAFEEAFAQYIGVHFAAGVGSGTDAIRLGGLALGLKAGDKVVTTPNTYISTAMALSIHGIIPVLCDIDPETYNMDPAALADVLKKEKGVKACIPVHLYGHPCQMDEILGDAAASASRSSRTRASLTGPCTKAGRWEPSALPRPSASTRPRIACSTKTSTTSGAVFPNPLPQSLSVPWTLVLS